MTTLESGIVDLLSFGGLGTSNGGDVTRTLRLTIKNISVELLPEAIGLTDAFGFTDWELDRFVTLASPLHHDEIDSVIFKITAP